MITIPFFMTCYYFRYFGWRKFFSHPVKCGLNEKPDRKYEGEFFLVKFHRIFFWLMLAFILIHLTEAIAESAGVIEYNYRLFVPYVFPFTTETTEMQSVEVQTLGEIAEWFYISIAFVFLFSCHFLRHFIGGTSFCFSCGRVGEARGKLYRVQTKFNNYHGLLFWLSISSIIFILLIGGHLWWPRICSVSLKVYEGKGILKKEKI